MANTENSWAKRLREYESLPHRKGRHGHPRVSDRYCLCQPRHYFRCSRCGIEDEKDRHQAENKRLFELERRRLEPIARKIAKAAGVTQVELGEFIGFIFRALKEGDE